MTHSLATPESIPNIEVSRPNVYEVAISGERKRLMLNPSRNRLSMLTPESYEEVIRRARRLWSEFGGQDRSGMDGQFVMDLAASPFDDESILQFAHARRRLQQDQSILGRIRSVAAAPFNALMETLDTIKRNTTDRMARAFSNDPTATLEGSAWIAVRGKWGDYTKARDEGRQDMGEFIGASMSEGGFSGAADKALLFGLAVVLDPLVLVGAPVQLTKAGRAVRAAGQKVPFGAGRVASRLGFRTDPADVERFLKLRPGEITLSWQEAFKSGRLADLVRAKMGRTPKDGLLVDNLARSRNQGHVQGILPNAPEPVWARMWTRIDSERTKALADNLSEPQTFERVRNGVIDEFSRVFDGRKFDETERLYNEAVSAQQAVLAEMDELNQIVGARATVPVVGQAAAPGIPVGRPRIGTPLGDRLERMETRNLALQRSVNEFRFQMSSFGTLRQIPRRRMSQAMRDWADRKGIDVDEFGNPGERIRQGLIARGVISPAIRSFERVSMMTPHRRLRVDDPGWSEQLRRMFQEFEVSSAGVAKGLARRGKAPLGTLGPLSAPWRRLDTEEALAKAASMPNHNALGAFVQGRIREAYHRIGVSEDELSLVLGEYSRVFGRDQIFAVTKEGKKIKTPLVQSQLLNDIALVDTRLYRRVAGLKAKGKTLDKLAARNMADSLNSIWRQLAVLRPAYAFRVVFLSEQMRLLLAGHANLVSHPIVALSTSFPRVGENVVKARGLFRRSGTPSPKAVRDIPETPGELIDAALSVRIPEGGLGSTRIDQMRNLGGGVDVGGTTKFASLKHPNEKELYTRGWLDHLNRTWGNDAVAKAFWARGASMDEALEWMAGSARRPATVEGRRYAENIGLEPGAPGFRDRAEEFLSTQREVFKEVTRGDDLVRQNIGRLGANDIAHLDPPAELPVTVFQANANNPSLVMVAETVDSLLGGVWKWIAEKPTLAFSRRAPYRHEVVNEMARLTGLTVPGQVEFRKMLRAAAGETGVRLSAAERQILRAAQDHAERSVKQAVYDLAESARVADQARYLIPFSNAWQEELTRWFQLTWQRPGTAATLASFAQTSVEDPAFTWEDPQTGEKMFMLPFGDRITSLATGKWNPFTKGLDGLRWPIMVPWENLFMVTSGDILPGFGPWVQVPVGVIARNVPATRDVINDFFPFATRGVLSQLIPSPVMRQLGRATDEETSTRFAAKFRDVLAWHLAQEERTGEEVDFDQVRRQTRALFALDGFLGIGIGGGAAESMPPATRELVEFYRFLRNDVPEAADRAMIGAQGKAMAVWLQSVTRAKSGTAPPTEEALNFLANGRTRELHEKYGPLWWTVAADLGDDENTFDPLEFARQVQSGEREVLRGEDLYDSALIRVGWVRWSRIRSAAERILAQRGISNLQAKGAEQIRAFLDQYREVLFRSYPGFEEDFHRFSERQFRREKDVQQLSEIMAEPEIIETPIGGGLRDYFLARAQIRAVMRAAEIGSLDTQGGIPLKVRWLSFLGDLLRQHPVLRETYERVLSRDTLEFDVELPSGPITG